MYYRMTDRQIKRFAKQQVIVAFIMTAFRETIGSAQLAS